jgi:hypothetical protein
MNPKTANRKNVPESPTTFKRVGEEWTYNKIAKP